MIKKLITYCLLLTMIHLFFSGCYSVMEIPKDGLYEHEIKLIITIQNDTIRVKENQNAIIDDSSKCVKIYENEILNKEISFKEIEKIYSKEYDGPKTIAYTALTLTGIAILLYIVIKSTFKGRGLGG